MLTPDELRSLVFGTIGGVAVEVVNIVRAYEDKGTLAKRYRQPVFLAARTTLALIGGALAVAYGNLSPLLAFHVGAATPAIVQNFSRLSGEKGGGAPRARRRAGHPSDKEEDQEDQGTEQED